MSKTLRSTDQLMTTDYASNIVIPLTQAAGVQGNQMTGWYTIRRVGPLEVNAGDEVDLRAYEQIDNESTGRPGDPWVVEVVKNVRLEKTIKRQRVGKVVFDLPLYKAKVDKASIDLDPRRTLPVMIELGVWRSPAESVRLEHIVIRNQGENADNMIHHWTWARADTDLVPYHVRAYYETRVRFAWSAAYWYPGAKMEILDRGMLSARVLP